MEQKRHDDLVKLVNITGKGSQVVNGEKVENKFQDVIYTYAGHSHTVKEFEVIERSTAEHAVVKTRLANENRAALKIEELPEGQRTKTAMEQSGAMVNELKGQLADLSHKNKDLEDKNVDLVNENAKLRAKLAKKDK